MFRMERRKKPSRTSAPARPPTRASSRPRDTCCACGARRCNRPNAPPSARPPPPPPPAPAKAPAPTPGAGEKAAEFLVTFTLAVPPGTAAQAVEDAKAREAQRTHDLAGQGHLLRVWTLPGARRALGLYQARDAAQMQAILESLPLAPWMTMDTTPLSPHPSDPGIIRPPTTAPAGTP